MWWTGVLTQEWELALHRVQVELIKLPVGNLVVGDTGTS